MWIDCVSLNEYDFIAHRSSLALCYWDVTDSVKVQKFDQGHWSFNFLLTLSSWREPNKFSLLFVRPKVILNQAVTGSDISFLRRYTFFQIFLNFSKIKIYISEQCSTMNSHIQLTSKCVCMCAKSLHSCLTLCIPMDCGPSGSSIRRILQAKMMEWVALPSSRRSSWPRDQTCISYISYIGRWVLYH